MTVLYYSSNPGAVGCPVPGGAGPNGSNPLAVHVLCNDGSGVLLTVGWYYDLQQYVLDLIGPEDMSPVSADFANAPVLTSVGPGPGPGTDEVCVRVPAPTIRSDCDRVPSGSA